MSIRVRVGFLALALAFAAAPTFAEPKAPGAQKFDRALQDARKAGNRPRVIVRYREGARQKVRQRLGAEGGRVRREHAAAGAISVDVSAAALKRLAADPDFLSFHLDDVVHGGAAMQDPAGDTTSNPEDTSPYSLLGANELTPEGNSFSGFDDQHLRRTLGIRPWNLASSVGIAIIDSGIHPVPDVADRIQAFYDFTGGQQMPAAPNDPYGHGTHIAGLIAGNGAQSSGRYVGVAFGARLIGLKVLDANGAGYTSDVIAAIDFAVANKSIMGIDIINLSLGHPIWEPAATDPLVQAVERAARAGIVVVATAGNFGLNPVTGQIGYAGITSPGNAPSALTVGALRTKRTATRLDDEVSAFSSRGPTWYDGRIKPDVIAPGQALVAISHPDATLFQNPALHADVQPYIKLSGTSMAAGVASGVAALVIEANRLDEGPGSVLAPNAIKAILQFTAIQVPDPDPSTPEAFEQGAGGLNAAGAMAFARAVDPGVPLNTWWLERWVPSYTCLVDACLPWSSRLIWGDHIVWGDTVYWQQAAWGHHIVWGDDDGHIVWGDDDDGHIVWGDTFVYQSENLVLQAFQAWANHIVWGDGDEHIVWGDDDDEHIVWGDTTAGGTD